MIECENRHAIYPHEMSKTMSDVFPEWKPPQPKALALLVTDCVEVFVKHLLRILVAKR